MLTTSVLRKKREDSWGLLARESSQIPKLRVQLETLPQQIRRRVKEEEVQC